MSSGCNCCSCSNCASRGARSRACRRALSKERLARMVSFSAIATTPGFPDVSTSSSFRVGSIISLPDSLGCKKSAQQIPEHHCECQIGGETEIVRSGAIAGRRHLQQEDSTRQPDARENDGKDYSKAHMLLVLPDDRPVHLRPASGDAVHFVLARNNHHLLLPCDYRIYRRFNHRLGV